MEQNQISTTTLRDFLKVIFRQKAVFVASFVTVMITVLIGVAFQTPMYEGTVKMMVSAEKQVDSPYYRELAGGGGRNIEVTLAQSEIVTSNPVIQRAVEAIALYKRPLDDEKNYASLIKKPFIITAARSLENKLKGATEQQKNALLFRMAVEDLKKRIKVEPIRDTNLFTISVKDYNPEVAMVLANVVSRSYLIFDLQQQLAETQLKYGAKHPTSLQLQDNISAMINSLNGQRLPDVEAIGPASVKIIEQANMPLRFSGMPKSVTVLLAFFMALFLGILLSFVCEYMDQTFKSPAEVENILNLAYLGAIPKNSDIQSYAALAEQLFMLSKDKQYKTMLFFSSLPEEGVTNTIANVGMYLAKNAGHRTLIVDANLRSPALHKNFRIPESNGLAEALECKIPFEKAVKEINPNLAVVTSGKTALNPVTLLDSNMMQEFLRWLKGQYEIILIDSPHLNNYRDASILASFVDANCLVVTEAVTRKQVVKAAIAPLQQKRANIIGVIMNNRSFVLPQVIYDMV